MTPGTMRPIKIIAPLSLTLLLACNSGDGEQITPSPGVLEEGQNGAGDTSRLITDSVVVRDTNTADIESMKKIN